VRLGWCGESVNIGVRVFRLVINLNCMSSQQQPD